MWHWTKMGLSRYMHIQGPRRDSGSVGARKVWNALENDPKMNFWENIPGKVQFQKKKGVWPPMAPPSSGGLCNVFYVHITLLRLEKSAMYFQA